MKMCEFHMVAEIERDPDGRVVPKRFVSGPYADYLAARHISAELGDDYHVFELTEFEWQ